MAQQLKIDIVAKDRSKRALNSVQGTLSKVKNAVFSLQSAFIGLGAGLAIRSLVNTGKQIEGLQVRLKFLFGSVNEGTKAFDEMAKFAAKVPFSLEEIQAGSGVLAVVSKDAKELANLMEITGNVAAVTGLDFKTTAEQIQRSMSAGISAADLFRDRGVKSMLGFKAGAVVTVEETAEAFTKIFGKGGKFGGATDELAKTFEGTLSMIGDKFFNFKRTILEAGFFSGLKKQFGDLNKTLEQNSAFIEKLGVGIGTTLAVAVEKLANGIKLIAKFSNEVQEAFKLLISYKIAAMLLRWGYALVPIVASMTTLVSLTGVGLIAAGLAAAAGVAVYVKLGDELDNIAKKTQENYEEYKILQRTVKHGGEEFLKASYAAEELALKTKEAGDAFMKAFMTSQISKSHNAMQKIMNTTKEIKKTLDQVIENFKIINDDKLEKMKLTMEDITIILIEGIHSTIKKVSQTLAESVVFGKDLAASFKAMAQGVMVKIIAHLIEQVALMTIQKFFKLEELKNEETKDNLIRRQNTNLKRQIALQAILAMFGGSFLSTSGGSMAPPTSGNPHRASGGAVAKGHPTLVGERGPELFVPNQTGQITQNARGVGGGSTTVNFNINTVDARGFDELLTQSRGTITQLINQAVNERGAKSII